MADKIKFETFRGIDNWQQERLTMREPSCFNGIVYVRRYRITCEVIEEPDSVIVDRLQKLYWESNNSHDMEPLQSAAKKLGAELTGWGKDRKKRT